MTTTSLLLLSKSEKNLKVNYVINALVFVAVKKVAEGVHAVLPSSNLSTGSLSMTMKRASGCRAWTKSWMRKGGSLPVVFS